MNNNKFKKIKIIIILYEYLYKIDISNSLSFFIGY